MLEDTYVAVIVFVVVVFVVLLVRIVRVGVGAVTVTWTWVAPDLTVIGAGVLRVESVSDGKQSSITYMVFVTVV